ncbi:hypothetical protein [Providencia hangzhouensis]|uniref:hypothetical protein n=1 Tax=Providencia hangzhouensis TaxID=3031799 RepID=UPI003F660A39
MDKSRQQFEAFIKKETGFDLHRTKFPMTKREDQQYSCHQTNLAWLSWQASRESLINNLPESINCPTAPELIWLQVDPEPEEENKPVYPVNLYSGDVTWSADREFQTDTLYIRADLIQK